MASRIERVSITGDVAELRRRRSAVGAGLSGGAVRYEWLYQEWTAPATYKLNALPYGINHVSVNGLTQREGTDYTVDYSTGVITFTSGVLVTGDTASCSYVTTGTLVVSAAAQIVVPWNTDGWRYKQIALTDATDYSAPTYNDSAWSVGAAPFGSDDHGGAQYAAYGGYATAWTLQTRLWIRRAVGPLPTGATGATVILRVDNVGDVYWNGTLLGSASNPSMSSPPSFVVPGAAINTTNLLAIRGADDGFFLSPDSSFLDCEVIAQ